MRLANACTTYCICGTKHATKYDIMLGNIFGTVVGTILGTIFVQMARFQIEIARFKITQFKIARDVGSVI